MVGLPAAALAFFATIGSGRGRGARGAAAGCPRARARRQRAGQPRDRDRVRTRLRRAEAARRVAARPGRADRGEAGGGRRHRRWCRSLRLIGPGDRARLATRSGRVGGRGRHDRGVGIGAFAALGLLLAGTLRPEATLVVANTLFLVALLLGGVLVPLGDLPGPLRTVALASPFGALAEAFRAALGGSCRLRRPSGDRRRVGRDRGLIGRDPHLSLGVRPRVGKATSGRSRSRSTRDPISHRTPRAAAMDETNSASRTPMAFPALRRAMRRSAGPRS